MGRTWLGHRCLNRLNGCWSRHSQPLGTSLARTALHAAAVLSCVWAWQTRTLPSCLPVHMLVVCSIICRPAKTLGWRPSHCCSVLIGHFVSICAGRRRHWAGGRRRRPQVGGHGHQRLLAAATVGSSCMCNTTVAVAGQLPVMYCGSLLWRGVFPASLAAVAHRAPTCPGASSPLELHSFVLHDVGWKTMQQERDWVCNGALEL